MNGQEKSGLSIVVKNPANKAGQPGVEQGERREGAKGNAGPTDTYRTPSRAGVSPGLDRVRQAAKAGKETRFTALLHPLDVALRRWAYHQLKRDAAVRVDDVTWAEYGQGLEARLTDLHGRAHPRGLSGTTVPAPLHPKTRRPPAATGDCRSGGQNRPTGASRNSERDLRGRFPRVLVWVSAGEGAARRARRVGRGD
jgi:hypothetical protein